MGVCTPMTRLFRPGGRKSVKDLVRETIALGHSSSVQKLVICYTDEL